MVGGSNRSSFARRAKVYVAVTVGMLLALWFASELGRWGKTVQTEVGLLPVFVLITVYLWDSLARMTRFEVETGCVPTPTERRAQRTTVALSLKSGKPPATQRYDPLLLRLIDHQLTALRPDRLAMLFGAVFVGMGLYMMVLLNHVGPLILFVAAGAVVVSIMWTVMGLYSFPKRRARLERLRSAIEARATSSP